VRAALIERYGEGPVVRDVNDPAKGQSSTLVKVLAAGLNPVDLSIASGRFYAGSPPTPYIPGSEGVGRVLSSSRLPPGARVYFETRRGGGSLAERVLIDDDTGIELPEGVDDGTAIGLGVAGMAAWLALEQRAQLKSGETVLVLGASGVLGLIAVQVAKILGAKRVIAAARDQPGLERALTRGADAIVDLKRTDGLADAFKVSGQGGVDVVLDPLWGAPASAAIEAMNRFGRLVQVGQSAGPEATLKSSSIRGRTVSILGYTSFAVPPAQKAAAYRRLLAEAAAGRIQVDYEAMPLDAAPDAWRRQSQAPHRKLILTPE
jgi:NADPH:quinone reductase